MIVGLLGTNYCLERLDSVAFNERSIRLVVYLVIFGVPGCMPILDGNSVDGAPCCLILVSKVNKWMMFV